MKNRKKIACGIAFILFLGVVAILGPTEEMDLSNNPNYGMSRESFKEYIVSGAPSLYAKYKDNLQFVFTYIDTDNNEVVTEKEIQTWQKEILSGKFRHEETSFRHLSLLSYAKKEYKERL